MYKKHQGFTLITLMLILGLIGFFALLIMTVGPIYMDHQKVKSALEAVKKDSNAASMDESGIRSTLDKRFDMNYVSDLKAKDVKITKNGSYLKMEANYEVVKKIAGNLSVLVQFNDVVEVGKQ